MAMIDYGAIVIKNGKILNENEFFMDMDEAVGWNDEGREYINPENGEVYKYAYLNGNYFAYIGDEDFTLGFYKSYCQWTNKENNLYLYADLHFRASKSYSFKSHDFTYNGVSFKIKELGDGQFLCTLQYKSDNYKVIFGYGIDSNLRVWDNVKYEYCDKKTVKKIDNILGEYR